jgi:pimeloyl-ACP methyl ester carboxylesterase
MALAARLVRGGMTALGTVVPPAAAEIGWRLWRTLGKPASVHPRDAEVHARAVRSDLTAAGQRIATYTWGAGPEVVLLVHGWRDRASRFSQVVEALESPDRTIVAFDAPGNGDSSGEFTTILDYIEIIRLLSARHGGFAAIVAHSFGVLSTFVAVREGASTDRIVGISGMHAATQLVDEFQRLSGLPARAMPAFRSRIERGTFRDVPDIWRRFVAELDPADVVTPVLLVHDRNDSRVDVGQAELIAEAHTGPMRLVITEGLGHTRILRDETVLGEIRQFVDAPLDASVTAVSPR